MSLVTSAATSSVERPAPRRNVRFADGPCLDWGAVVGKVRRELVRADLTERQFRVAEFFVSATLERGRQFVKGVRLEELGTALGLTKGNVSEAIAELQEVGVLQVYRAIDGVLHRILPDSTRWFVSWRYTAVHREGYLQALDVASGQDQGHLLEREPDLREAIAAVSMEAVEIRNPKSEIRTGTSGASVRREDGGRGDHLDRRGACPTHDDGGASSRASFNRNSLSQISNSVSNFEGEGVRVLGKDVSSNGNFEGAGSSTDFTEGQKAVKVIGEVPNSGTGVVSARGGEQVVNGAVKALARNWSDDDYIVDKLRARCVKLFEELWAGRTRLARDFCALYSVKPGRARALIGAAVDKNFPARWLNVSVSDEWGSNK